MVITLNIRNNTNFNVWFKMSSDTLFDQVVTRWNYKGSLDLGFDSWPCFEGLAKAKPTSGGGSRDWGVLI